MAKKTYDFSKSSSREIFHLTRCEIIKHVRDNAIKGTNMRIIFNILITSKKVLVDRHRYTIFAALNSLLREGSIVRGDFDQNIQWYKVSLLFNYFRFGTFMLVERKIRQ